GQHTAPLEVTRLGAPSCTLDGYPSIALLDARGHKLGFRYSHRGDFVVAAHRPHTVHVGGYGSGYFLLNKYRCDIRALSAAQWRSAPLCYERSASSAPPYAVLVIPVSFGTVASQYA